MKKSILVRTAATLALMAVAAPVWAWGPRSQVAIVGSAARMVSKQDSIRLVDLGSFIERGASASPEELAQIAPQFEADPLGAIELQMYLLQSIRDPRRIDPYFAYRLGVLGKMVAEYTSPMADADPAIRDKFFADVDKNITNVPLKPADRRAIDPRLYLPGVRSDAQERRNLIEQDYEAGVGFGGVAKGAFAEEASRSINAVADVWHTVLTGEASVGNIAQEQLTQYLLNSMSFNLKREKPNLQEVKRAYDRLQEANELTPALRKRVGDMYFDAGQAARAMEEYKLVLEQDPGNKEVAERVAQYYAGLGDKAIQENRLEEGLQAYQMAQQSDPTSLEAQQKKREAENLVNQRNERLEQARQAITQAQALQQEADQMQLRRSYGEAIESLDKARQLYAGVPAEFGPESQEASRGITEIDIKARELRQLLVQNTDQLSGTGFTVEARRIASQAQGLTDKAMQKLVTQGFQEEVEDLRQEMDSQVASTGAKP